MRERRSGFSPGKPLRRPEGSGEDPYREGSIRVFAFFAALVTFAGGFAACRGASFDGREYPWGTSPPDPDPEEIDRPLAPRGERLYSVLCAACHGKEGRGDGPAAAFCASPPTDFSRAEFKVRSTPSGELPTDADLAGTIRRGAGGDGAMPGFPFLTEEDLRDLLVRLKSFSPRWAAAEKPPSPLRMPPPRPGDPDRGAVVYQRWGCAACHGERGGGDGPRVPALRNSRGHKEIPTDLTRPWTFKGGSDETSLARSLLTGFNGTTMPAFGIPPNGEEDFWDLVWFLRSLQRRRPEPPVRAQEFPTLESYWKLPIPLQGGDLSAASCAPCHPVQFADWSRSRHARALGPGVLAQLLDRPEDAPSCLKCHAPLEEQALDRRLASDGVSCSGCHSRAHAKFGPPPTGRTLLPLIAEFPSPHGRAQVRDFFEKAEFCAGCRQFREGEAPRVHGKFLMNTFEEWKTSPAAAEGKSCQSCHMPGRRHFFRGIHDPQTVRSGVRWDFHAEVREDRLAARLTLVNAATGHCVPTYAVPEIWLRLELRDPAGTILSHAERLIARKVSFAFGRWWELSDTRLAPGQAAELRYEGPIPPGAAEIVARGVVLPDALYRDLFESLLSKARAEESRALYLRALDETRRSGYTLFRSRFPLRTP